MADPSGKGAKLTRTRVHEHALVDTGKGLPIMVSKNLKPPEAPRRSPRHTTFDDSLPSRRHASRNKSNYFELVAPETQKSFISELSQLLDLEEYDFPDEETDETSAKADVKMDVTALDRYNDDIRRIRKLCIEECRTLPLKGELDEVKMIKIKAIVRSLCRTAYYGTIKAQNLAESTVTLIVWLLHRRNMSMNNKVHILQSLSEMLWSSPDLKSAFCRCNGVKLIAKLLLFGMKHRSDISQWACYTLAMASCSSTEIIKTLKEVKNFDLVVGELAFPPYWADWPANFGQILQAILYGPYSVIPVEEEYDFL